MNILKIKIFSNTQIVKYYGMKKYCKPYLCFSKLDFLPYLTKIFI